MTALKTCRNHALQFLGLREFLAYRETALPRPGFFMYLALLETPRPRYFQAAFCTTSSKCEVSIESEVSALPGRQPHGAEVWSVVGAGQAEDDSGRWSEDAWHWTKPRQHETCLQPGSREALLLSNLLKCFPHSVCFCASPSPASFVPSLFLLSHRHPLFKEYKHWWLPGKHPSVPLLPLPSTLCCINGLAWTLPHWSWNSKCIHWF